MSNAPIVAPSARKDVDGPPTFDWLRPVVASLIERARLATVIVTGALVAAAALVAVDAALRWTRLEVGVLEHLSMAGVAYAALGGLVGAAVAAAVTVERAITGAIEHRRPRWAPWVAPCYYGLVGSLLSIPIASYLFAGRSAAASAAARWGPWLVLVVAGVVTATTAAVTERILRSTGRHHRLLRAAAVLVASLLAAAAAYADQTLFVALYVRLHSALEAVTVLLFGGAAAVVLYGVARRWPGVWTAYAVVTALAVGWSFVTVVSPRPRVWASERLAYTARQPVYVDRLLGRIRDLDGALEGAASGADDTRRFVQQIMTRYDIASATLDPAWTSPPEPPSARASWEALGIAEPPGGFSVVVFYVDSLRYDVATDPGIMPHLAGFAGSSLHFRRAYSSASDTVEAMPALLTGRYAPTPDDQDLLSVARDVRVPTTLLISLSARRFLAKEVPRLALDEVVSVRDYAEGKRVWGYGADQPTAAPIVDAALERLGGPGATPSLTWLFHFDLHNWRELDENYVRDQAKRWAVPDEAPLNWRYRVVARAVDAEFGRLLAGLEQLGVAERTIVLVFADHGEALGRDGFWVHGVFLWESLVHVPLMLRVPGLSAQVVDRPVGHVDLFATLAPLLDPSVSLAATHGEPLWDALRPDGRPRRFPLLLQSMRGQQLLRVGLVDGRTRHKLVLALEAGVPELYDLGRPEPDDVDLAAEQRALGLRLLSELVRSPVFPRPAPAVP